MSGALVLIVRRRCVVVELLMEVGALAVVVSGAETLLAVVVVELSWSRKPSEQFGGPVVRTLHI